MKRSLLISTIAFLLALPTTSAFAESSQNESISSEAQMRPRRKKRKKRVTRRRRAQPRRVRVRRVRTRPHHRVVVPRPVIVAPRPVIVVPVPPPPPVVVVHPAPPPPAVVYEPAPVRYTPAPPPPHTVRAEPLPYVEEDDSGLDSSFVVRFSGISKGDTELSTSTFDGPGLSGLGLQFRFPFDNNWSIELAGDVMVADEDKYEMITIPLSASILGHLFPDNLIDVYGIVGGGIHLSNIDYSRKTFSESYKQWEGHIGVGVELDLGGLVLTSDLRFIALESRPEFEDPSCYGPVAVGDSNSETDSWTEGVQFTVGAGWSF